MKLLYASSIRYPARYANRVQTLATAEALRRRLGDDFILAGNHIHAPGIYEGRVYACHTRFGPLLALRQLRLARRERVTHIFSRESNLLMLMLLLNACWFRLPVAFSYEAHDLEQNARLSFVLRHVAQVFCLTAYLKMDIEALVPGVRATVLPDGVDVRKFEQHETKEMARTRLGIPDTRPVALYIGRLDGWKGLETLYAAADLLPDIAVVAIGGAVQEIPGLQNTYPRVTFLGPRPYGELPDNMAAADVLILPNTAKEAISARYTSPLKLFAYMTSGIPIIATDLPALREVLDEKAAYLIPPDDPKALAAAVYEVLANPQDAHVRAQVAKKRVGEYDWANRAGRILETLERV